MFVSFSKTLEMISELLNRSVLQKQGLQEASLAGRLIKTLMEVVSQILPCSLWLRVGRGLMMIGSNPSYKQLAASS